MTIRLPFQHEQEMTKDTA